MIAFIMVAILITTAAACCLFGVLAILLFAQVTWILWWGAAKAWARMKRGVR